MPPNTRRAAAMQPYLFPYLGYFQLIAACDQFAFLDDVQYIRRGWINRNYLMLSGRRTLFTVPVAGAPRSARVLDVQVEAEQYHLHRRKLLASIEQSYGSAPHFEPVRALIESVLRSAAGKIGDLAAASVRAVCEYLGLDTPLQYASTIALGRSGTRSGQMVTLAQRMGAGAYINPAAGIELYDRLEFAASRVELFALHGQMPSALTGPSGQPLSIVDSLMRFDRETVREALGAAELVPV